MSNFYNLLKTAKAYRSIMLLFVLFAFVQNASAQYCGAATTNNAITVTTTPQLTTSYNSGRRAFNFAATAGRTYVF